MEKDGEWPAEWKRIIEFDVYVLINALVLPTLWSVCVCARAFYAAEMINFFYESQTLVIGYLVR